MSTYGRGSPLVEWGKFLVYKLGNVIGFTSPLIASIVGMLIWFFAWVLIPGSFMVFFRIPLLNEVLGDYVDALRWGNRLLVAFMIYGGMLCL